MFLYLLHEEEGLEPVYSVKLGETGSETEAEWEVAARGGLTGDVWTGCVSETRLDQFAWYKNNSNNRTHEVKKKLPNGYGLYDMSGNVSEWCWDWYGDSYPTGSDPVGPDSGLIRVRRGGFLLIEAVYCRASYRGTSSQTNRGHGFGLRLVRSSF